VKLSTETLSDLPETVLRPTYDRASLTPGIVHIGLGNFHRAHQSYFHRAHQSWYLHRLMQEGLAQDWAIIGAGVRAPDEAQRIRLAEQDFLTTLIELDPAGQSAEVVGSMIGFVPVEEDNAALIAQMADPAIRIVALTVTESGYYIDPVTKAFDAERADIQYDAAHPDAPRTAFGAMIAALKRRRDNGTGPFTGQSCDNLQGNGAILRQTVVSLARLSDPDLAEWIDTNCTFPNSMVDCIVPATGPQELALVNTFGIDDAAPVTHENFRQWIIEDDFCAGRPDWDKVGATLTNDVHAFEAMKIRILNGGHQVLANAGEVLSVETISGCMAHPLVGDLFRKIAKEEVAKHVHAVVDTVRRVAYDGSSRHTGFVLPVLRDALAKNGSIEGLALSQAIWARMCEGTREDGTEIEPNDPIWDELTTAAKAAKSDPQAWLQQSNLYGDLADDERFSNSFSRWLQLIWTSGTEAALRAYLKD